MTLQDAGINLMGLQDLSFDRSSLSTIPDSGSNGEKVSSTQIYPDLDFTLSSLGKHAEKQEEKQKGRKDGKISSLETEGEIKGYRQSNGELKHMRLKEKRPSDDEIPIERESLNDIVNIESLFKRVEEKRTMKEAHNKIRSKVLSKTSSASNQIWADKYRPNNFLSLCSAGNDRHYRLILHWLKKWSHTVYHEEMENEFVDYLGRPYKKILLVSGPSGVGKTSAVHVLAKQMGYHVEELNAANSTDTVFTTTESSYVQNRQNVTSTLQLRIKNALSMNTLTSKNKPTCLVIDEIDSSSNANDIIKILSDLVSSDARAMSSISRSNANGGLKTERSGKKKDFLLNRPIICIANDLYSSGKGSVSMEKLRPFCEVVSFKKPNHLRNSPGQKAGGNALRTVKEHLMKISEKEKLDLDFQDIGEIVETCDGDIRACLNHLQFSGRKLSYFNETGKQKTRKDGQISWFSLIDTLFRRDQRLSKDENFDHLMKDLTEGYGKSVTTNSSLFEKVMRGSFAKYLDSVYNSDDSLAKPCEFSDWLCFYDITTRNSGASDTESYNTLIGLKIWSLFSEINPEKNKEVRPLIENVRGIEYEAFEAMKQNKDVLRRLDSNIPIDTKLSLGGAEDAMACYVVPCLSKILNPHLTTKVKMSQSQVDKTLLKRIAKIMNDFKLEMLSGTDNETNQVDHYFSPDIDCIVQYNTDFTLMPRRLIEKQNQQIRPWLFPLLQSEMDKSKLTREVSKRRMDKEEPNKAIESANKKLKSASSVDFFKGRYDGLATQINEPNKKTKVNSKTRIWVKYNEGFSNAVRKNIGWSDLWIP